MTIENETVWLTQAKLGILFDVDRTVINRHIHNIYKTGELEESATCAKIAQVQIEGGRKIVRAQPFYNLDMIIAVGYRVNSLRATRFRQWATSVLRNYLMNGVAVNARLNQLEDKMDRRLAKQDTDIAEQRRKWISSCRRRSRRYRACSMMDNCGMRGRSWSGLPLKDLGAKCFGFTKMDAGEIPHLKKSAFADA